MPSLDPPPTGLSPRFPHQGSFAFGGRVCGAGEVIEALAPYVSDARRERIEQVVRQRTYTVATVVEGLYDLGNVHAVMRSAEGLGFPAFHVVEAGEKLRPSGRASQGAEKWLDVARWPTAVACAADLKRKGYRLAVTHLDAAVPISRIDFTRPTALAFGNEAEGASKELLDLADIRCVIPMAGFVQSFNISVAAAVGLHHARADRLRRQGFHGDLSVAERETLQAVYMLRSVKRADRLLARLLGRR